MELSDRVKQLVPSGLTIAETALRWCLDFDAVSVIIPGARNVAQAQGNARTSVLAPLSRERHVKLAAFYEREVAANIRGPY